LLPEERDQAAAPEGGIYLGRRAVTFAQADAYWH
jgi:hypothetical protein